MSDSYQIDPVKLRARLEEKAAEATEAANVAAKIAAAEAKRSQMGDRRERIATAALQGILASVENGIAPEDWAGFIVRRAVVYADSLIAELDKEPQP